MRETSAGADPDRLVPNTIVGTSTTLNASGPANYPPGSTKVFVTSRTAFNVGEFAVIGPVASNVQGGFIPIAASTVHNGHTEIRRVEHIEVENVTNSLKGWLHFDRPLAFNHHQSNGTTSTLVSKLSTRTSANATADSKHIKFVPGVYDTIDTPDPEMALEPRYFLGQSSMRNFTSVYTGQHTYQGALNGIILLNGWPLRWGIGTEIPIPRAVELTRTVNSAAAVTAGDVWVKMDATTSLAVGNYLIFNYAGAHTLATADPTVATSPPEVNKIRAIPGSGSLWVEFEHPFKYNHAASASVRRIITSSGITHYIIEQNDLDSMCWHLGMKDSVEDTNRRFDRRWLGGKVGAMSILAEEGGLLTVNWDSIVFKDMIHNQGVHTSSLDRYPLQDAVTVMDGIIAAGKSMPGFAVMNTYDEADIELPTTEPYYFSGGSVKLVDGTEFARVRGFNISINNNEDPRYYIGQRFGNHKGPSEIREQRREYSMTCTLALPDTGITAGQDNSSLIDGVDRATSLFKELLLEGRYTANGGHEGFAISLKFVRGTFDDSSGTSQEDAIWIDIPGLDRTSTADFAGAEGNTNSSDITPGTSTIAKTRTGNINSGGAFIRSAPHTITTDAPLQVAVDMLFRNMTITIRDQEPYYP
tara:strand:+ start:1472 stop:3397 length:1926 start_codon:yes stop_codon:yes gene_type:complete